MSPLAVSAIIFGCIFVGALLGLLVRDRLPEHHLSADSKDVVKLAMGVVGTLAAMVLGLLVASAKSSFDAQRGGVAQMAANVVLVDRTLAAYGPEATDIRQLLRESVEDVIRRTWPDEHGTAEKVAPQGRAEAVYLRVLALEPKTEPQRTLQGQALRVVADAGQLRLNLLAQQQSSAIPTPFLIVLVFWLTVIVGSFGLFAPRNLTSVISLAVCALAVSSAIFLILELDRPFGGLIRLSGEPMRLALEQLGR